MQDLLETKDLKYLKYIEQDWKSLKYQEAPGANIEFVGVQGKTPNKKYFTQRQRYQAFYEEIKKDDDLKTIEPITWSAYEYEHWDDIHQASISWFDTAGCFNPY